MNYTKKQLFGGAKTAFLVILGPRGGGVKSPQSPQETLIYQNATYFYHFKPF